MARMHRVTERAELPDAELVELCAAGDEAAWAALVKRYKNLVYAVPVRAGLSEQAAEEVFHETFAKLAERIESIREGGQVRAWIVTTARRLTIDVIRARQRSRRFEDVGADPAAVPDRRDLPLESLERRETRRLVRQALQGLDTRSRQLLSLLFANGERPCYRSISRQLGIPTGSIGPTRARSLRKFLVEYRRITAEPVGDLAA